MRPVTECRSLRYGNWNAHSVLNKKPEIESMLHIHNLDILIITETWLTKRVPVWQFRGYLTFRQDRQSDRPGSGVLILVRNNLLVSPIRVPIQIQKYFDCICVNIATNQFNLQFVGVYAPPNIRIPAIQWSNLISCCSLSTPIILVGDFNAHSLTWGSSYHNARGKDLDQAIDDFDLVPLSDSILTYVGGDDRRGSNIDSILISSQLCQYSSFEVIEESYSSDHFLITAELDLTLKYIKSSTNRLNLKKVDWAKFDSLLESSIEPLESGLNGNNQPLEIYKTFIAEIIRCLKDSGAYYPSRLSGSRKSQPLWWDEECDLALVRRRESRKEYIRDQTLENRARFTKVDNEGN